MTRPLPPLSLTYQDRYCLRPLVPGDIGLYQKVLSESYKDLKVYMEWAHQPTEEQKLVERIAEQYGRYFLGMEYELALFEKSSGDLLFLSGIFPVGRINPLSMEIGFWTPKSRQNKGYATLGTKLLIAFIFEWLKGDRIEITSNLKNLGSLRVIEKCGFKKEGILRNFYPQGTKEMFRAGYTRERSVQLFSLLPEDRSSLAWYEDILAHTVAFPCLGEPMHLKKFDKRKNILFADL